MKKNRKEVHGTFYITIDAGYNYNIAGIPYIIGLDNKLYKVCSDEYHVFLKINKEVKKCKNIEDEQKMLEEGVIVKFETPKKSRGKWHWAYSII